MLRPWLVVVVAASLLACHQTEDETQEADHTSGEFGGAAWRWAHDTHDQFLASEMADISEGELKEFLPLDHPMAARLQFWTDAMDASLRRRHPAAFANIPHPELVLRWSSNINAWVRPVSMGWRVDVRTTATGGGEPETMAHLSLFGDGRVSPFGPSVEARLPAPEELESFAHFYDSGFASCRLTLTTSGGASTLLFGDGCRSESRPSPGGYRAGALHFDATSRFITMTTTLITKFIEEDEIVTILAHELGHFYRSHLNLPTTSLNYFYSLDETGPAKPAPDPRFVDETERARAKLDGRVDGDFADENALMRGERLGFYTTEQEADEIALEAVSEVGISPTVGPETFLTWLRLMEDREAPGSLKHAECAALEAAGWKDADGKAVSVPVGGLRNPHHSLCFRVFNLTRELAAHHYAVAERPTPPGEDWSSLVEQLATDFPGSPPSRGPIVYGPGAFPHEPRY